MQVNIVSFPDPPPKRKGGSGEYSTPSHYGLAVAMESAESQAFDVLVGFSKLEGVLRRFVKV